MPQIVFSILATTEQRDEIVQDFQDVLAANSDVLTATLDVDTGIPDDPSLRGVWQDHGFADAAEEEPDTTALVIDVQQYDGSISGLSMRLSEVLTEREKQPTEQLFQQIKDDAGSPRVPWHVGVRP